METIEVENGVISSNNMSHPDSPEMCRGSREITDVTTEASSVPQTNDISALEAKIVENETNTVKLEDTRGDEGVATTNKDSEGRKEEALSVISDSKSETESLTSLDFAPLSSVLLDRNSPARISNAYKEKSGISTGNETRNQGPNLVQGFADYLIVLEKRMDQLESSLKAKNEEVDEDDDDTGSLPSNMSTSEIDDSMIEIFVKFFNSHLIRVLYSKFKGDVTEPTKQADSTPTKVNDIDILTFGVSSETIALFFEKQLSTSAVGDRLIRFGKPFQPLIRNLGPVREHLKRLKSLYGRVMIGGVEKTRTALDGSTEASATTLNREESDLLPFAPAKSGGNGGIPAYDRPIALLHFQAFLSFIDELMGKQIKLYERLRNGEEHDVAFENLWMLLDTDVTIDRFAKQQQRNMKMSKVVHILEFEGMPLVTTMAPAFKMTNEDDEVAASPFSKSYIKANVKALAGILTQTVKISRKFRNNYTDFYVYGFYIDFNGLNLAYPAHYKLRKKLLYNGEKFIDATRASHLQYEGLTVGPSREEINSPVVIDIKLAFEGGSGTDKAFIEVLKFKPIASLWLRGSGVQTYKLFGNPVAIIGGARSMHGKGNTGLRSEESKIGCSESRATQMVQAMAETHTQNISPNKDVNVGLDLVQGKGKGCVILLHVVPGVGKTSTAECVAAHAKKPLYPITCGGIGVEPQELERNMDNHFKLANRCGCVPLLDKVDVFFAKRDQRDIQRNKLVSCFCACSTIDDAFRSRLHLTLYYPKLTKKQTKQIFENNFQRIADINVDRRNRNLPPFDYVNSEKKIMRWAEDTWKELRWNGRQIRNALQTALALCEFHAKSSNSESTIPIITKKDFKIAASASIQFSQYLLATHSQDEDSMVGRETVRAKNYAPSPEMAKLFYSDFSTEGEDSSDESEASTDFNTRTKQCFGRFCIYLYLYCLCLLN
ncbi:bd2bad12-3c9b-4ea3-80c5-177545182950 [Sclerotinia trifoliorum]|uniref:Bd2bad12-3c9b-4ea3-80c5-177545182950 n=1 Tax=Sclerotinia trifoliorum TaxID=28548 RepID=A0A8H2VQS3_9HELO|nr:bd2bad12-3c9b-4ea3-80c5-177545182950 [Sclerotinia trifoliorum]